MGSVRVSLTQQGLPVRRAMPVGPRPLSVSSLQEILAFSR